MKELTDKFIAIENKHFITFVTFSFISSFSVFYFLNLEFVLHGNDKKAAVTLDAGNYYHYFISHLNEFQFSQMLNFDWWFPFGNANLNSIRFANFFFTLARGNLYFLYAINFFAYIFICKKLYSHFNKSNIFLLCLALYPYIYTSFSPANKEISSILAIMYFSYFIITRNYWYLIPTFIISLSSRLELMIFLHLFTGLFIFGNQLKTKKQKRILYYTIVILTIFILNTLVKIFEGDRIAELDQARTMANFGFYPFLAEKTYDGYYFLTFPFHVLMNFFGNLHVIKYHLSILNPFFLYMSEIYILFLSGAILFKKKIDFDSELFILFLLYAIIFSITPVVVHRYVLPTYPLLIIFLTSWENRNKTAKPKYL